MQKRGQSSLEYVLLVTFVILALVPLSLLAYSTFNDTQDSITQKQLEQALATIAKESESIYYLGPPSKSTVEVYLPEGVKNVTIANYEINARFNTKLGITDVSVFSKVNMTGTIPSGQGTHRITIIATGNGVTIS